MIVFCGIGVDTQLTSDCYRDWWVIEDVFTFTNGGHANILFCIIICTRKSASDTCSCESKLITIFSEDIIVLSGFKTTNSDTFIGITNQITIIESMILVFNKVGICVDT